MPSARPDAPPTVFPRVTAEAMLAGLDALGLDAAGVARRAGLGEDALLPSTVWRALWREARGASSDPALPSRIGAAIPYGKLGLLDYLTASAETLDAALLSLANHMSAAAAVVGLHYAAPAVRVVSRSTAEADNDEFVVGLCVARFRKVMDEDPIARVLLNRPAVRGHDFYDVPVTWDAPRAGFDLRAGSLDAQLTTTDPDLHRTLREAAQTLGLGPGGSALETRIRARLPGLIRKGRADAVTVAATLGMSKRTLHRRLEDAGQSLQEILDAPRAQEAERLLRAGEELVEIAFALGYADQAAFTRAFTRWRGMSPGAWRDAHGG